MATTNDNIDKLMFDDRLTLYLRGKLSADDEAKFLSLIKSDATLKSRAVAIARLAKGLQQVGLEKDRAIIAALQRASIGDVKAAAKIDESFDTAVDANKSSITSRPTRKRLLLSIAVAASILICVFGGYKYYKYHQVTSLGYDYLADMSMTEIYRGEGIEADGLLKTIKSDIQSKKNLAHSISVLEDMWQQSISDEYNVFTNYMPEIGWILANAYLCDNSKDKALDILSVLIKAYPDGTAIGDKSRELQEKILKI